MVPFWFRAVDMATTLTLKNIPDELYARLKKSAEIHRRSLNNEAIICLETVLQARKLSTAERIERIRALRSTLPQKGFRARDIDDLKRQGRA
jgi:plasmid stability protein